MAEHPARDSNAQQDTEQVPVGKLAIYWTIVGVPLLWGVYQTFIKALALFQ